MRVLPRLLVVRWPSSIRIPSLVQWNSRRAARSAIWGVALFLALQLGLGILAETSPRFRDPLYGDKFVKLQRRIAAQPEAFTVVMLGSSRTGLGFHGLQAEEQFAASRGQPVVAFNFGIPASGPITHLVYLKRMLAAGVKPNQLFLEILPSMLADGHDGPIERHWLYADRLLGSERELVIRHGFSAEKVNEIWWKSVLIPSYTLRFQVMTRLAPRWIPWQVRYDWSRGSDECGWGKMEHQSIPAEQYATGLARAKLEYAPILGNWKPGGGACAALRELLELCQQQQIPVTLVLMPESVEFQTWYPPSTISQLDDFLSRLNVPVVDGRNWLPDDAFTDGHHQLVRGAETFTRRLIQNGLLSKPPPREQP